MELEYIVGDFESLEDIAKKFNISVMELKSYNNLTSLTPKTLLIPKQKVGFKVVANLNREYLHFGDANQVKTALSKQGLYCQNLNDVASLFKPKNNATYVVGVLDTLNGVCKKFGLNKEDLISLNNLKSERLFIGQILKLK